MKRKKKPSKPLDPKTVFQLACKFAATEQHVRSIDNPKAAFMASPSMVLSAFAIELFLKCLLLALLLTSPVVARAAQAAEGSATVPRFEPAPCPKLQGVEWLADASCAIRGSSISIIETRSMRAELALFGVPGLRRLSGLGCGFAMAFL